MAATVLDIDPIAVAGGGTGLIRRPFGKTKERQLLTLEQVEHNMDSIKKQIEHFLDFDCGGVVCQDH